jgi:hypothetical protein
VSADLIAVLLVLSAAPAATLFPIFYAFTSPWWRSLTGRALMTSSVGLALLIDISLLYQWLGDDYYLRDHVRLGVYALISAGAWMQLLAFVGAKFRARRR